MRESVVGLLLVAAAMGAGTMWAGGLVLVGVGALLMYVARTWRR